MIESFSVDNEIYNTDLDTHAPLDQDGELVLEVVDKNEDAFMQLRLKYNRELLRYVVKYTGSYDVADDVVQNTWVQVWRKAHQFNVQKRFRPWLYSIATRQAIDFSRANKRHQHVHLDASHNHPSDLLEVVTTSCDTSEVDAIIQERRCIVKNCLSQLPDAYQEVVHLVYFKGLKYREAADVLSIPVGTVKSRLHAAIKNLELELGEQVLEELKTTTHR